MPDLSIESPYGRLTVTEEDGRIAAWPGVATGGT